MERTDNEDNGTKNKFTEGELLVEDQASENTIDISLGSSAKQSTIVTARGTAEGLIIRLDGRVECDSLRGALNDFLSDRKSFVTGQVVILEWIGAEPDQATVKLITEDLRINYSIKVKSSEVRMVAVGGLKRAKSNDLLKDSDRNMSSSAEDDFENDDIDNSGKAGLFGGIQGFDINDPKLKATRTGRSPTELDWHRSGSANVRVKSTDTSSLAAQQRAYDPTLWDDADTRLICRTLRSGQKIETEHSLVIIGDVNSGAELVAGGDIIVIGALRGVAHAGAFDETGGGRFIFALDLDPTQLRIGAIISRGSQSEKGTKSSSSRTNLASSSEIARVDGNIIVVESYSARAVGVLRR